MVLPPGLTFLGFSFEFILGFLGIGATLLGLIFRNKGMGLVGGVLLLYLLGQSGIFPVWVMVLAVLVFIFSLIKNKN